MFNNHGRAWDRGPPTPPGTADLERRVTQAAESLGLTVVGAHAVPQVTRHELEVPRVAIVHSWLNTQNEGWVRYAFDALGIPYTYFSVQQLKDRDRLKQFDVIVLPFVTNSAQSIVNGLPMTGPPIPWKRSPETPNLGGLDSTDDVRPRIGLDRMGALRDWIDAGGGILTQGGTSSGFTGYRVTRRVGHIPARQLRASGGGYRAAGKDARRPGACREPGTRAV